MTELSARAQALLERARKEATPSAEDLSHLRARLGASLAKQGLDPVVVPLWLGKLGGVLLAAAVGLGGWYLRGLLSERDAQAAAAVAPRQELAVCPPAPACAPAAEPACEPVACPAAPAGGRARRGEGPKPDDGPALRGPRQTLFSVPGAQRDAALELQLLILAREALDEGRALDALGHALRHEQLFPQSAFEEERLAIEVLAYCAAGHPEQAAERFERLITLAPETSYLPRVRGLCGEGFEHE